MEQIQAQLKLLIKSRFLVFVLGIAIVVPLIGSFFYFYRLKQKPAPKGEKETVFCSELDGLTNRFADAKREIGENDVIYTIEGKILGVEIKEEVATFKLDLGKGILLDNPQTISVSLNTLPKNYFGQSVLRKEELRTRLQDLDTISKITLRYEKPCRLSEWEVAPGVAEISPKEETKDYKVIAASVLGWLDKQRNTEGIYTMGNLCYLNGKCEVAAEDNRVGLSAIWGRFKYFQASQDKKEADLLSRDLGVYADPSKITVIQNDFWNCKLMYEIQKSGLLSDEQKQQVEGICWSGVYPPINERVAILDLKRIMKEKLPSVENPGQLSIHGGDLIENSAFVSDFASRYLWKKDKKDLDKASLYFTEAVNLYKRETGNVYLSGRWILGIASIDFYLAIGNSDLLVFAKSLYEKEKIEELCPGSQMSSSYRDYCRNSLFERETAILFAQELFQVTKDKKYREFADNLLRETIESALDQPGRKGFFTGDSAFNSLGRGQDAQKVNVYKSVRENGLMVGILLGND